MVLPSVSAWLSTALRKCAVLRRGQRRRAFCFVPGLEALEARTVPAHLTVTSDADAGLGSLRAAIANANSGDTIKFASSVHLIALTTGQLAITKSLTIDGPGADKLTVSGSNSSRVFAVSSGVQVTIDGLTVANGRAAT